MLTFFAVCLTFFLKLNAQEPSSESNANLTTTNAAIPILTLSQPLTKKIDLNLTGSYVGGIRAKAVLVEIPFKLNKYLTIAPSYAYIAALMINHRGSLPAQIQEI